MCQLLVLGGFTTRCITMCQRLLNRTHQLPLLCLLEALVDIIQVYRRARVRKFGRPAARMFIIGRQLILLSFCRRRWRGWCRRRWRRRWRWRWRWRWRPRWRPRDAKRAAFTIQRLMALPHLMHRGLALFHIVHRAVRRQGREGQLRSSRTDSDARGNGCQTNHRPSCHRYSGGSTHDGGCAKSVEGLAQVGVGKLLPA